MMYVKIIIILTYLFNIIMFTCAAPECVHHMNQNESDILSPNYPNRYPENYRCVWYITVADNKYIALKVNAFHTELKHDLVSVYDGHTEADGQLLASYSGIAEDYDYTGVPRNGMTKFRSVISSGNKLLVKFRTDYVIAYKGFNITYESVDQGCGLTLNATRKEIVSPGYPSEYIFALVCVWNISVPSDMMVMITFADFETEYNFDYLRIHDGFDRNSSFVTYTGDNIPPQIIFVSNEIHIMFNSDHNKPRRGFNLTYHAFKKPGQNMEIFEAFTDSQNVTEYSARPLAYISIALNAMLVIVVIILVYSSKEKYNNLATNIIDSHCKVLINKYDNLECDDDNGDNCNNNHHPGDINEHQSNPDTELLVS